MYDDKMSDLCSSIAAVQSTATQHTPTRTTDRSTDERINNIKADRVVFTVF